MKDLGESTSLSSCCSSSPGASPCLCLTNDYGEHIHGSFQKCFIIYLWLGDDWGEAGGGGKEGLADSGGAEERVGWARESLGLTSSL